MVRNNLNSTQLKELEPKSTILVVLTTLCDDYRPERNNSQDRCCDTSGPHASDVLRVCMLDDPRQRDDTDETRESSLTNLRCCVSTS